MIYTYAKLRNLGPFAKARFDFSNGLIGVVGPNGVGKSTLIEVLYTAPTGDFRKYSNLADFVRDLPGGKKAKSGSFEVGLQHDNMEIVVRRTISITGPPSSPGQEYTAAELAERRSKMKGSQTAMVKSRRVGSDEEWHEISGVKAADERLRELLGDDLALLGHYAFIEQNQISAIVDSDDSTRTKAMHRLFGLDQFERIWSMLGEELRGVPELRSTEDLDALKQEREGLQHEETAATQSVSNRRGELSKIDAEGAQRDIDWWESAQELRDKIVQAEERCVNGQSHWATQQQQHTTADSGVQALIAQIVALQLQYDEANQFLAKANAVQIALSRRDDLDAEAGRIAIRLRALKPPVALSEIWTDKEETELQGVGSTLREADTFISSYRGLVDGSNVKATCPTCGQAIPDLMKEIEKFRARRENAEPRHRELVSNKRERAAQRLDYERACAAYDTESSGLQRDGKKIMEDYQRVVGGLPEQPELVYSDAERSKRRSVITEYDGLAGSKITAERNSDQCSRAVNLAKEALDAATTARSELNRQLTALVPELAQLTLDSIERCRQVIKLASDKRVELARAEEQHAGVKLRITALLTRIERAERLQEQIDRVNVVRSTLDDARDLFHRGKLPQLLARRFLQAIDLHIQRFLDLMQSDFTAALEQHAGNYSFRCTFADTSDRDASSLSGGEKVRFSVSFLLAVNEVMSARLGILALDEPTAQLDEDNIQYFVGVLSHVQQYAHSAGVQIFLITHSPQLLGSFDQAIVLRKGGQVEELAA
jgi:DNA repair exonuclease SbcCD ATPase subunit